MNSLLWTNPAAPRIWRAWKTCEDEPLHAAEIYTDEILERIADEGFTGIWVFCRLYDLMQSQVFPGLNDEKADERIQGLSSLSERAGHYGIGVYLYFNEPAGLASDHPFWNEYSELKGASKWNRYALCPSTPQVSNFFRDALTSVFSRLNNLAGVFLITGSEDLTHCWSKVDLRAGANYPDCPRCRERDPADLVIEQLKVWMDVRQNLQQQFRIWSWNWSWHYWGDETAKAIARRLPEGIELLLDMEFGGERRWKNRTIEIGEYSLGYVGPCRQFKELQAEAGVNRPVHAKIEINVTHELCSVPNLPVLSTLHSKFRELVSHRVSGFLGCWTMGSCFTLNTFALKLFLSDPQRFLDSEVFLDALAREYFGFTQTARVVKAWSLFSRAMEYFPFSVRMLYCGPQNDAPARPLSLHYCGASLGASYLKNSEFGDNLMSCIEGFMLDEVCDGFADLSHCWSAGMTEYEAAFEENESLDIGALQELHRREELSCARMIEVQFRSVQNSFLFFREQLKIMERDELSAPCFLPAESRLMELMVAEIQNAEQALILVQRDDRLGFHGEMQDYKYTATTIQRKIAAMTAEVKNSSEA